MMRLLGEISGEFPEAELRDVWVDGRVVDRYKAVVNKRTGHVYSIQSRLYQLIQHRDVANAVREELRARNYTPEEVISFEKAGARMFMRTLIKEDDICGDKIRWGVLITNSYDGSMGIWMAGYGVRTGCLNQMVLGREVLLEYTIHMGRVEEKIRDGIEKVLDGLEEVRDIVIAAMESKISAVEAVEIINNFPISKVHKERIAGLVEKYASVSLDLEAPAESAEITRWNLYNAFTEAITYATKLSDSTRVVLLKKASSLLRR